MEGGAGDDDDDDDDDETARVVGVVMPKMTMISCSRDLPFCVTTPKSPSCNTGASWSW
jgi:hypothetical protein